MVSYLCEITTHRGQCFHPTPPPCFTKQGKNKNPKVCDQKKQLNSCGMVLYIIYVRWWRDSNPRSPAWQAGILGQLNDTTRLKNKFDLGWVLTLIASCSLSFRNKVLIAQDLYTPISLLVRRIRLDLWCFHQDYHSHYTTLYSHVQAKDSCRIRRMPPPALSLLTILLLHLASSIRLHITKRCRSITAFSSSVGNTFAW